MKRIFFFLFFLQTTFCYGQQQTIDVDKNNDINPLSSNVLLVVGGSPFVNTKFTSLVEGTPYFNEQWMQGKIVLSDDRAFAGLKLKLDLIDNHVHYMDSKGQEMISVTNFQKVVLTDTILNEDFEFINSSFINAVSKPDEGWYQKLSEGDAGLYKYFQKRMIESKTFGFATVEQRINTSFQYYILYKNSFKRVKKLKEIADILSDKRDLLLKYIQEKKLSEKKEEDYISLVNYYNSLSGM